MLSHPFKKTANHSLDEATNVRMYSDFGSFLDLLTMVWISGHSVARITAVHYIGKGGLLQLFF